MLIEKEAIEKMDRKYRLNLVNSISGIKPANLIGTRSVDERDNLAIFSSVVHLGSHPAQLGMVIRPQKDEPRDTYRNILDTRFYTINHIPESLIKKAHYTSAKLDASVSEFDRMQIERTFIKGFPAPFVKESPVKIGMRFMESIPLPNGCLFVVGTVELIELDETALNEKGQLDLAALSGVGISGLNTYYTLQKKETHPYVRVNEIPDFKP